MTTRGVPVFHALRQDLQDLDLLIAASLRRIQTAETFVEPTEFWELARGGGGGTVVHFVAIERRSSPGYRVRTYCEPERTHHAFANELLQPVQVDCRACLDVL